MRDSLGDRMKGYERVTQTGLIPRTPVVIRVDGRAFHTFTRGMRKPFDPTLANAMVKAACYVAEDMQNFLMGYVQSDEASFVMNNNTSLVSQPWFDNNLQKIVSITASRFAAKFNQLLIPDWLADFDSRAFNIEADEVPNYFLWRMKDWYRNSVTMYARSIFTNSELDNKSVQQILQMLRDENRSWESEVDAQFKYGTMILPFHGNKVTAFTMYEAPTYQGLWDIFVGEVNDKMSRVTSKQ